MSLPLCIESSFHGEVRLRVEFVWERDRYRHVVAMANRDGSAVPCLESAEGTAKDAWPVSPPLQSLSIETLPDGRRVALLVGMAGRSHWSASIEPAVDSPGLVFDVACRTAAAADLLGSHYQRAASGANSLDVLVEDDRSRGTLRLGGHTIAILPALEAPCAARLSGSGSQGLHLAPAAAPGGLPVRWKYEFRLEA